MIARFAGVDLALTCTGVAVFTVDSGAGVDDHAGAAASTARIVSKPADKGPDGTRSIGARAGRMHGVVAEVVSHIPHGSFVVIEGLSYGSRGSATRDLAGVWWMCVDALRSKGCEVIEASPQARAKYAAVSGRAGKDEVLEAVRGAHPSTLVPDHNVADAVALAALGARAAGFPVEVVSTRAQEEVAAGVSWRGMDAPFWR